MCPLMLRATLLLALTVFPLLASATDASRPAPASTAAPESVTVKGTVKDKSGEPMIGVSVYVKETKQGVATDIDGNYSLTLPNANAELTFSYVGCKPQTVKVAGRTVIDVVLEEENTTLNEVVVVAMGIRRKESSLTYATQQVKADELNRVQDASVANQLEGKISGVTITPSAGGAGGNSKITLRGNKSILGSSAPLIVVDGVPMTNTARGQASDAASLAYSGVSEGSDPLSMINPDDIESINVLKGANAAALYGSVAANGVLMITTKKGKEGRIGVTFSSNVTFDTPLLTPKFQNVYGARVSSTGEMSMHSWGDKLASRNGSDLVINVPVDAKFQVDPTNTHTTVDGVDYYTRKVHLRNQAGDDLSDFYDTGVTTNNSIALSGGTDKMSSYFSYGNSHSNGMLENNNYNRHTIAFKQNFKFFNRLNIDVAANYIQTVTRNRPGGGTVLSPIYHMYTMPRNVDIAYYRDHYAYDGKWMSENQSVYQGRKDLYVLDPETGEYKKVGTHYQYASQKAELAGPMQDWAFQSGMQNNPYWLMHQNKGKQSEDRFFGNIAATLDIWDGLSFQARVGIDNTNYLEETKRYATTFLPAGMEDFGHYGRNYSKPREIYTDFMLNYNKSFGKWDVSATAGYVGHTVKGESQNTWATATYVRGDLQQLRTMVNYFDVSAGGMGTTSQGKSSDWDKGALVTAQIGWNEAVYFDASYRQDWYRSFRQFAHRGTPEHYGYFGFGANAVISKLAKLPEWWTYLKGRASYSEVGNSIPNQVYSSVTTNLGTGSTSTNAFARFEDPRPEKSKSFEVGFESLFLRDCLSFDLTYYNATMANLYIIGTNASGKSIPTNSAKVRNQGFEATLGYDFRANDLRWKTSFNVAYNVNKILKTAYDETGTEMRIATDVNGVRMLYKEGGAIGDMYVTDYKRDEQGHYVLNSSGAPMMETENSKQYQLYAGNMNSKWQMGWTNSFYYKNFSLSFMINGRIGGKVISLTESYLDNLGLSERTGQARMAAEAQNIVATDYGNKPGMVLPDGSGRVVPIQGYYETIGGQRFMSNYIYNGTNFRLRELSLGYTFQNLLGANRNLSLSLIARNLFFLYKDCPTDPDVSLSTANGLGGIEVFNMPSARSVGFSLKVNF